MTDLTQHNALMELIKAKTNLAVAKATVTALTKDLNFVTGPTGPAAEIIKEARTKMEDEITLLESDIEVLQDQIKFETTGE